MNPGDPVQSNNSSNSSDERSDLLRAGLAELAKGADALQGIQRRLNDDHLQEQFRKQARRSGIQIRGEPLEQILLVLEKRLAEEQERAAKAEKDAVFSKWISILSLLVAFLALLLDALPALLRFTAALPMR